MTIDILMLVDRLEAVINGGSRLPLTDKVVIDEREALDVLDLMRTAIPEEIKQSRRLNQEREKIITEAQADANRLIAQAQEKIDRMLDEDSLVQAADERARQIEDDAQARAEEIRAGADEYAYGILRELDEHLSRVSGEVRNGMQALAPRSRDDQYEAASEPE